MSDGLYQAPSEARARKRRRPAGSAGTSFYIERGRPFQTMRDYRDRRREPEARKAVQLARQLAKLAGEFPRFRLALHRLQHHVLLQVRAPSWKERTVLKFLDQQEATSIRELSADTGLDRASLLATLDQLSAADRVMPCNRAGLVAAAAAIKKTYWLKK